MSLRGIAQPTHGSTTAVAADQVKHLIPGQVCGHICGVPAPPQNGADWCEEEVSHARTISGVNRLVKSSAEEAMNGNVC
jgi:hypothetical protein